MQDASLQTDRTRPKILITAEEAFPEFERRVLAAERNITMAFRIFDPRTKLRSPEGRAVGDTWIDLLGDALERGVRIELHISDFDPVAATPLHMLCWHSVRVLCGLREMVSPEAAGRLTVHADIHPAKIGRIARIFVWPLVAGKMRQIVQEDRGQEASHKRRVLKYVPGVAYLRAKFKGRPLLAFPASHHQKLASFDDRWLYIGGLDLNERRWDTKQHEQPAQETWHDVQVLVDDPDTARSARRHIETYNHTAAGHHEVATTPGLLRTLSCDQSHRKPWSLSPRTLVHELSDTHLRAAAKAEGLIYIETQFFRDRGIARALAKRARDNPKLRMILILPAAPETVAFEESPKLDGRYGDFLQSRCIRKVRRAFGKRLLIASPAQPRKTNGDDMDAERASLDGAPIIYLHAKASVFNNELAVVSSANLNGRSMRWDTEAGLAFRKPEDVTMIREALFRHWLPDDAPEAAVKLETAFEEWRSIIYHNSMHPPEQRRGFLLPYDRKAAEESALPLPGVPEEMV
ncbi:phospholipase D family protein [Psychromarinibacter halotolerans]|uniref:Phospholipase D n=1 Tax=Psychromarinibacter halotolerans TaxID=1775175 RepID=A0ABV7GPK9_9RHOB|nr:phospholipase D-like domain-containing protein [Psychromarinibacter halotolerans]MDF0595637.1 phospholipase D-like domain-containing protein [Psychromarinibacter halotolerans]